MRKKNQIFAVGMAALLTATVWAAPVNAEETVDSPHIWDGSYDISWFDSEETVLELDSPEALFGFAKLAKEGKLGSEQTFRLTADLYMNDISDYDSWGETAPANAWTPIGENVGTLDGCGHSIYGLYGEFFEKNTGTIQNLNIESCYVKDYKYAGGICGTNYGTIDNCDVSGYVRGWNSGYDGIAYSGGISAFTSSGTIKNCRNTAQIEVYCKYGDDVRSGYAGGISGYLNGATTIEHCLNAGSVTYPSLGATRKWDGYIGVGGIFGKANGSNLSDGTIANIKVKYVCNTALINSELITKKYDYNSVGGIGGIISDMSNEGTVTIQNACNKGDVTNAGEANSDMITGGIIGYAERVSISNVYNTGMCTGLGSVGAIIGYAKSTYELQSTYYLNVSAVVGIGNHDGDDTVVAKSAANMKKAEFADLLGEAFSYQPGDYPRLLWEVAGDLNYDDTVDKKDAALLQAYLLGRAEMTEAQAARADIDGNGILNAIDLTKMKQK